MLTRKRIEKYGTQRANSKPKINNLKTKNPNK